MKNLNKELKKRVDELKIVHDGIVIIERIDHLNAISDSISLVEQTKLTRIRDSCYGVVYRISDVTSDSELFNYKKSNVEVGDIICYSPDTAYCLNINIPKTYREIWVVHIDNILCVDKFFEIDELRKVRYEDTKSIF